MPVYQPIHRGTQSVWTLVLAVTHVGCAGGQSLKTRPASSRLETLNCAVSASNYKDSGGVYDG